MTASSNHYDHYVYQTLQQWSTFPTKELWLAAMMEGSIKPKPPASWVRQQLEQGRSESAAYAIWHRNYTPGRKYVIWDQAPLEDWKEHGYYRA